MITPSRPRRTRFSDYKTAGMATTFHKFLRLERELRDRIYCEVVIQEEPIEFDQRVQDYHAFDIEFDGYVGGEVSSERMEELHNDMDCVDLQEDEPVDEEYEDPTTTTDYYCNIQTTSEGPIRRKLGSLSILWVSKRVQRESAKIAYSGNTFSFKETNTLGLWLNQIGPRNCRYIKHLRVDCLDYENRVGKANIAVSIGEALQHLTLSTDLEPITIGHEFACQLIDDDASLRNNHFLAVMGMANAFYLQFNAAQIAEGKTPRDRSQMLKLDPVPTCGMTSDGGRCLFNWTGVHDKKCCLVRGHRHARSVEDQWVAVWNRVRDRLNCCHFLITEENFPEFAVWRYQP